MFELAVLGFMWIGIFAFAYACVTGLIALVDWRVDVARQEIELKTFRLATNTYVDDSVQRVVHQLDRVISRVSALEEKPRTRKNV